MLTVLPAVGRNARWIGKHLREEDRQEVEAATGSSPVAALLQSYQLSRRSYIVLPPRSLRPCAIFGVADDPRVAGMGCAWMLCTPEVTNVARAVLREAPRWLNTLAKDYPTGLHCLAWANNYLHVRWCKHGGFVELGRHFHSEQEFIHLYRSSNV